MKATLTIQKTIVGNDATYERERDKLVAELEAKGWSVDVASEDEGVDE